MPNKIKSGLTGLNIDNCGRIENMADQVDVHICSVYMDITKYVCLLSKHPICNKCTTFESDEKTVNWKAGASVGYCNLLFV